MKILFTGGGTAGHAMVNTILIPRLHKRGCRTLYIGSENGLEKELVSGLGKVRYYGISTGKLRRYFDWKNVTDVFRIGRGTAQAFGILRKEKPDLVYSSGGYVSVPVVWAARLRKIPVVIRETDATPGLANRLCFPFARKIYLTFPDTAKRIKDPGRCSLSMLIRPELYEEKAETSRFSDGRRPVCLIMGGSSGALSMNRLIWDNLSALTERFQIIHLCGRGKGRKELPDTDSYRQIEYAGEMGSLYREADVVVTRSGSNAVIETLLLGKRTVCIPLSGKASRGEQMENARFAEQNGTAVLREEEGLDAENLIQSIHEALLKPENHRYKSWKGRMEEKIERHVEEICGMAEG